MKDEDNDIGLVFNESVDFLFGFDCESVEFLGNENDLSELDNEDFVTNDVIVGGFNELSFPILEHVWAKSSNGLWLESYYLKTRFYMKEKKIIF